ncbi:MAG: ferrous iron transport protein B [Anaerolineales bacterium]|nr:ferrous iron transport protein B [Anaerolineales bacterium]
MPMTIALAGNPNAGKSTIFNALTGSQQHIGNYPGKTIERKEGLLHLPNQQEAVVVDLPGTYSLTSFSAEEIIAREFILEAKPTAVVAVVDAANLERNLYLVVQLLEIGIPLILALNMCDVATKRGIEIDRSSLSRQLGNVPIVPLVGSQSVGIDELKAELQQFTTPLEGPNPITFPPLLERERVALSNLIEAEAVLTQYPSHWVALKLLEGDTDLSTKVPASIQEATAQAIQRIVESANEDPDILIADSRYALIGLWIQSAVHRHADTTITISDRIDRVLTHPVWGIPLFLAMMWLVFQFTANVSAPYVDWVGGVIEGPITHRADALLTALHLNQLWVRSLVVDGVIAGVGNVLAFVPVLVCLFLALAVLEDSGYMARAALVMDRFMRKFGLHGKSFLPLVVGFGCSVPAVYATRTLENETDRKITAFLATFMSCGARLPVYVLFGAIFFGRSAGNFIFAMYFTGIGVAVLTSLLMTRFVFRGKEAFPLMLELPPYRIPRATNVFHEIRTRTASFLENAGTLILAASFIIWLFLSIPMRPSGSFADVEAGDSLYGNVAQVMAPVFQPAGFGDWRASGALISGFVAKEVVIASLGQTYVGGEDGPAMTESVSAGDDLKMVGISLGDATLLTLQETINIVPRSLNWVPNVDIPEVALVPTADEEEDTLLEGALADAFTPISALAFNIFILLYIPCMATVGAMRHEFGTRWMLAQVLYTLVIAWAAAVLVYQVGSLL